MNFNNIIIPVILVTSTGLIGGLILAFAAKIMAVKENEMVQNIRNVLPGANCGACGYKGCDDYANALGNDSENKVKTNLCTPGGHDTSLAISETLGVKYEEVIPMYAVVKCSGDCDSTNYKFDYKGIKSCVANKLLYNGHGECKYGCLGMGDCVHVCEYGAITITDGLARVDKCKCEGCGKCAKACPNLLIELINKTSDTFVFCSSKDKGAITRKACGKGCIGCKKCERVCENGAVSVNENIAYIDTTKCTQCKKCVEGCPTKAIH